GHVRRSARPPAGAARRSPALGAAGTAARTVVGHPRRGWALQPDLRAHRRHVALGPAPPAARPRARDRPRHGSRAPAARRPGTDGPAGAPAAAAGRSGGHRRAVLRHGVRRRAGPARAPAARAARRGGRHGAGRRAGRRARPPAPPRPRAGRSRRPRTSRGLPRAAAAALVTSARGLAQPRPARAGPARRPARPGPAGQLGRRDRARRLPPRQRRRRPGARARRGRPRLGDGHPRRPARRRRLDGRVVGRDGRTGQPGRRGARGGPRLPGPRAPARGVRPAQRAGPRPAALVPRVRVLQDRGDLRGHPLPQPSGTDGRRGLRAPRRARPAPGRARSRCTGSSAPM
ncbi:MAG: acyl-CoA dehydrogenase, putative phosphotransferase, partial [uncultured Frankineae bacterium]